MIALINGAEGATLYWQKGANQDGTLMLLNDDGTIPAALAADTVTLEVYADASRSAAAVASHTCAVGTVAAGIFTIAIAFGAMSYGPGTYYVFAKRLQDDAGTPVHFSRKYCVLVVG